MNCLEEFGVGGELCRNEFLSRLGSVGREGMKLLRMAVFEDAYARGLMSVLAPVERKKNALKSVVEKHMEDVWELVCIIMERREFS